VLCLDGVDQEGSAALDGDRQVIRSLQEKGTATRERSLTGATVELSQRLGDSALMTVTATTGPTTTDAKEDKSEPTSLLLIKSEAGWRIRDLFRS
jgi:eukaryotic-like serine/threonine-protein kinase